MAAQAAEPIIEIVDDDHARRSEIGMNRRPTVPQRSEQTTAISASNGKCS